jgi:ribosome assembly protein 1
MKGKALERVLWGDFYLDPKTKRVLGQKHLKGRPLKAMFVQLVLDNIWAIYAATTGGTMGKGCVPYLILTPLPLNLNEVRQSLIGTLLAILP